MAATTLQEARAEVDTYGISADTAALIATSIQSARATELAAHISGGGTLRTFVEQVLHTEAKRNAWLAWPYQKVNSY